MMKTAELFTTDSFATDIKGKTVRGGVAMMTAQVLTFLLNLVAIPILSRLLTPADFGLVAMATAMTGFASMFVDAGLSMATVHQAKITVQQVNNLFWLATSLGLATALLAVLVSPAIAWFYGEPRLQWIVIVLSLSFVFSGLTIQHQALLQRAMRYRELSMRRIVGNAAGLAAAILWAWCFRNYWALVIIPVVTAAAQMVLIWISTGWRPGWYRKGAGVRKMVHFGANLTGFNFINYFSRHLDTVLIGWQLGAVAAGLYSRAYLLMILLGMKISGPLTPVIVPALCRLRDNPTRYRSFFQRAIGFIATCTTPPVMFIAFAAHEVVRVILGPEWMATVPVVQAISIAAIASATGVASGWVYVSFGHVGRMLRWGAFGACFIVLSMVIGLYWGVVGVAAGVSVAYGVLKLADFPYAIKGTFLELRDFLIPVSYPTLASLAAAIATLFIDATHLPNGTPVEQQPFYLLGAKLILFISVLCLLEFALPAGRRHAASVYDVFQTLRARRQPNGIPKDVPLAELPETQNNPHSTTL